MDISQTIFLLGSISFWFGCQTGLNRVFSGQFAIAKNANHFIHAILFAVFYRLGLIYNEIPITYLIMLSIGFYTYDYLFIVYSVGYLKEPFMRHLPFIVHHQIAIYGLYLAFTGYFSEQILYIYYLLELSNFMLYTSYHISKKWQDYKNLQLVSFSFQFVWYSYFRIVRFGIYLYKIWEVFQLTTGLVQLANWVLFLMGLYWSFNLFSKCLRELRVIAVPTKKKLE